MATTNYDLSFSVGYHGPNFDPDENVQLRATFKREVVQSTLGGLGANSVTVKNLSLVSYACKTTGFSSYFRSSFALQEREESPESIAVDLLVNGQTRLTKPVQMRFDPEHEKYPSQLVSKVFVDLTRDRDGNFTMELSPRPERDLCKTISDTGTSALNFTRNASSRACEGVSNAAIFFGVGLRNLVPTFGRGETHEANEEHIKKE